MTATPAGNRWAVVLSNNAVKELRKLERDQNALEIVHKKIKDLSLGQFSLENYRAILGSTSHIPLFRARVSNNLRIVYQIDLAPDPSGAFDHQVIKIFRIAPRPRINYNFWVKVSVRLKRVNPIYKTRCEYRLPAVANDKHRPAMFPHVEYGLGISNQDSGFLLNDLTLEEREEIQEITMDRFAPLNKSLYNSIAADLDMALPMVLDEHERRIVNHSGASIVIGRSGTGKTTALIYKMRTIEQMNTTRGNYQPMKQLFVTRSRVLAQHVEATYQGLVEFTEIALKSAEELKEMAKKSREDPDRALVEFDSEIDLRNDLPERFSDLQDSHFPLFISFDKLCALLEADIRHILPGQIGALTNCPTIGFEEFLHSYWPYFRSTYLLEPNLVYSEIVGVIKGSQAAFESREGYLTRNEYVNALNRRQFPLLADIRDRVYSIFELYAKNKRTRGEIDAADRTRLILQHLRQIIGESKVDYLYIDEVQDNLMIDIHLLRTLAKSVDNIYWSGDSAQTVVAGSAFRINDLKAFTYRDQAGVDNFRTHHKAPAKFATFELNVNFRSLSGIVRFAGYVVQAIHNLFPESIDLMEAEKAKHYGDPPILFTEVQNEAGYFENFLLGSSTSNRVVFGAQQAILVRDAEAAEELDSRLQGLCNVLPIMDSKGLEFDDVLIYNFFSQSAAPSAAWGYLAGNIRGNQAPPPVLCSELKLLYVATTRARRRCWIWDSDDAISQLKTQWISSGLVKVERASQMIGRLTVSSNKAQWVAKGREYFSHRLYKLAAACFRQADHLKDAKLATAYHLMTRAKLKRLRGDNPSIRVDLIIAASELEDCAQLLGTENKANVYYHAATCYESACELVRASAAYIRAGQHTHGVQILFDARDFNNGASALVDNRRHLDKDFFESLRNQARMHFFSRREYNQLQPLFDSAEEKIKYARDHNLKVQLKHVLEEHHYYDDLATEHLNEGDLSQGVEYYVMAYRHHRTESSIKRAVTLTIEYMLLLEGVYRKNSHELAKSLIRKVHPFASQTDSESRLTVDLFYAYMCYNQVNLDMLQSWDKDKSSSQQHRRVLASYLAIKDNSWLHDNSVEVVVGYLKALESLLEDINGIVTSSNPSGSQLSQKLLGFSAGSKIMKTASFIVSESSLIYRHTNKSNDNEELTLTAGEINSIIRQELPKRIHGLLDSVHTTALTSPWVSPLRYSTSPPATTFSRKAGRLTTSNDSSTPKLRVLCDILAVLDTSTTQSMRQFPDLTLVDQLWLQRLLGVLCSATGEILSFSLIKEASDSVVYEKSLKDWLQRDLSQLQTAQMSGATITHGLLHMLVRSAVYHEFLQPRGLLAAAVPRNPNSSFNSTIIQPLQELLFGQEYGRLDQAIQLLQ
ncbi:TPR and ankyrin repeat-containing protein 1 OS=Mus musculus GN=Trank1 PE=2 SV=3 [Rhizoctonia solani AG-1 IB]|uniref:TPR and ankyrin repeat-containing protein 1 n=1 Tax=Thanatephorus cucumeris (strain AG1-IB / isolate 7/3/14) TaxID=1108050 RepID=A0A0B7FL54_THACB|nr:TPR and ankyrin repeat-containing protein 1 OS=Mus musculus GN=Trank1 PE=2 SV=3 [Rhizoctonia solani AG-1 IB]